MDSHKRSAQLERLEVVETGRRRRRSDDEKLRIVTESFQAPRAISSTARRHGISRSLLMTWRRSFGPAPISPQSERFRFAWVVLAAEVEPAVAATPASGQMVFVVGRDRRVIVDAGLDAAGAGAAGFGASMIPISSSARIWIATGYTDIRKGMQGLSLLVQESLGRDPFAGDVFVFGGRSGSLIKALWHDGIGLSLYAKRLDRGRFVWPVTVGGVVGLTAAQMSYPLEARLAQPAAHVATTERRIGSENVLRCGRKDASNRSFCDSIRAMGDGLESLPDDIEMKAELIVARAETAVARARRSDDQALTPI